MQDGDISPLKAFFRNKWVRIILIIDAIAILVVLGIIIYNATKVSTINFNITPVDSTISVNGNTSFENGTYSITPGAYEITISHEGFNSKTFTIDIAPHHDITISTFLSNGESFEYYTLKNNYSSMQKLQEIASKDNNITTDQDTSAEEFIAKFQDDYSMWEKKFPLHFTDYEDTADGRKITKNITIKTSSDSECQKTLCVRALMAHTNDKEFIKQILTDQRIDLEYYDIIYEIY